jgi:uncharacterized protein
LSKFLLLVLVIVVVWRLAQGVRRKNAARQVPPAAPGQMVSCSHCGIYLPQSEAVAEDGKFFCCAEHRRLAG